MLRIRLRKPGKSAKRRYHWKIVVTEMHTARESRFVEQVGHYDPSRQILKFDEKDYQNWLKKGAQPTQTVVTLFKRYQRLVEGKPLKKRKPKTKGKKNKSP